jgi:hypothetical protein
LKSQEPSGLGRVRRLRALPILLPAYVEGTPQVPTTEAPWAERRLSELPGVIDELRTQLAEADRRRTKLLEDLRLERNALEGRLNTALAELAALKTK